MPRRPSDRALVERWRALHSEHARVEAALDRELEREHRVSSCELDVMQRLLLFADGSQRIQDLADSVLRSHSAISRMMGRLESQGLVARTVSEHDRRGVTVTLTAAGRRLLTAAERTQAQVLAELLAP